jgi:hypothetical protein
MKKRDVQIRPIASLIESFALNEFAGFQRGMALIASEQ